MNRFRKAIPYVLIIFVLLIYLVFANDIIISAFQVDTVKHSSFSELQSTTEGKAYIDYYGSSENIFEYYSMIGWAFGYTEAANDNKTISIVFKDHFSDDCYVYTQQPYTREDVYLAFADSVDIMGESHGFNASFSVLPMKEGLYDLYIYVIENDESKVLLDMNLELQRTGNKLMQIES